MDFPEVLPEHIRYIRLGAAGVWLDQAIAGGFVPLGYREIPHEVCIAEDWIRAEEIMIDLAGSPAAAKRHILQVRDFYELPETALWITLGNGHLWWTFADKQVLPGVEGSDIVRTRRCIGNWNRFDLKGVPLTTEGLSSSLTKVRGYQGTICKVDRAAYLLRRIRGEGNPLHDRATALQTDMRDLATAMIRELHWQEFETFIDLIFMRGGWRRVSLLGKTMPDVDLLVDQPLTGERAWVQIKSKSTQAELLDYVDRFKKDGSCERFFFACHSPAGALATPADDGSLKILVGPVLADLALEVGLFGWLVERTH